MVIPSRHGMQNRWFLMPRMSLSWIWPPGDEVRDSRELTTYSEEREIGRAAHQTRQQVLLDETEYGFKRCTLLGLPQAAVASRLAHPSFQEHVLTLCKARNVWSGSKQVGPAELSLRNGRTKSSNRVQVYHTAASLQFVEWRRMNAPDLEEMPRPQIPRSQKSTEGTLTCIE